MRRRIPASRWTIVPSDVNLRGYVYSLDKLGYDYFSDD